MLYQGVFYSLVIQTCKVLLGHKHYNLRSSCSQELLWKKNMSSSYSVMLLNIYYYWIANLKLWWNGKSNLAEPKDCKSYKHFLCDDVQNLNFHLFLPFADPDPSTDLFVPLRSPDFTWFVYRNYLPCLPVNSQAEVKVKYRNVNLDVSGIHLVQWMIDLTL